MSGWNFRTLRMPMAVSFSLHAAFFFGLLFWWHQEGAPAPRGDLDGLEVTLIRLAEPAPKNPLPAEVAPIPQKPVAMPKPVAEKKPQPVIPPTPVAPLPMKEAAKPAPETPQAPAQPTDATPAESETRTASLAPPDLRDGRGDGTVKGFEETAGRDSDDVLITEPRFRVPPRPPVYPRRARELEQEGEALVRARLDPAGNPQEVLIWKSSGYVLLDNAAMTAVRGWQFEPARRGGKPIVAWVQIPVRFALN